MSDAMRLTFAPMQIVPQSQDVAPVGRNLPLKVVIDCAKDMLDAESAGVRVDWSALAPHMLLWLRDHQQLRERLREMELRRA